MRIIAGSLSGRIFASPHSAKTHPMSDKVRGALFNVLGDIDGLRVLDAFAGSGALSFEALSRGAQHATAIESDIAAQRVIAENANTLGVSKDFKLIKANAGAWLSTSGDQQFDIVLCDPPYNDTQQNLIQRLLAVLSPDGILVVSWPGTKEAPEFAGATCVLERNYGDAQLLFYNRT